MESGLLVEWLIAPGDHVARGDVIAVVETDKGEIEIEAFEEGEVGSLLVREGDSAPVGALIATLVGGTTPADADELPADAAAVPVPTPAPEPPAAAPPAPPRVRASPAARMAAERLGVDLAAVTGTGPGGAVGVADVERAATGATTAGDAGAPSEDPSEALRRAVGAAMARSKREIPHYYVALDVDMGPASAFLDARNADLPPSRRLVATALLVRALGLAVRDVPELNGHFRDGRPRPSEDVNVGVAVAMRGGGVVAPAIHEVDRLDLAAVMEALRDLVTRARAGRMRGSEVSDGTITLSALGSGSVDAVHGVIYPPQVAIVGAGTIADRPWVVDGSLAVRPVATLTLAGDHRVSDGRRGGRLLMRMADLLMRPEEL